MCPKQFPSADSGIPLSEDGTRHLSLNGVTVNNGPMYTLKHQVKFSILWNIKLSSVGILFH